MNEQTENIAIAFGMESESETYKQIFTCEMLGLTEGWWSQKNTMFGKLTVNNINLLDGH